MKNNDKNLYNELNQEDSIGLVLRGLLHVEQQLTKYIAKQLLHPDRVDWSKIDYTGKVEMALSCGLAVDVRPPLEYLEALRNKFAYSMNASIEPEWVIATYNSLPKSIRNDVELMFKEQGKKFAKNSTKLDTRDLLVLIVICVAGAIETEIHVMTATKTKPKTTVQPKSKKTVKKKTKRKK